MQLSSRLRLIYTTHDLTMYLYNVLLVSVPWIEVLTSFIEILSSFIRGQDSSCYRTG